MPGDILDTIDNALADWSTSPDGMRWRPEGDEDQEPSIQLEWSIGTDAFPLGYLAVREEYAEPAVAEIREGDVVTMSGHQWRVTARTYANGVYTFDLEPADLTPLVPPRPAAVAARPRREEQGARGGACAWPGTRR